MAIKRFDGYKVNLENVRKIKREDGSFGVALDLSGNIEIGIEIDSGTWREDWILKQVFKDKSTEYKITAMFQDNKYDESKHMETNHIVFTAKPR